MTKAEEIFEKIQKHLDGTSKHAVVVVATMTKAWMFKPKHRDMFRISSAGDLQIQRGKAWDIIAHPNGALVGIRFGEYK